MNSKGNQINRIIIILSIFAGALILFIPLHKLLILLIGFLIFFYFLINPKICFYLMIFTIPYVERLRILPISFSANDLCILMCFMSVIFQIFISGKMPDIKTKLDGWNIVLLLLFFAAGITSISDTGLLASFKFFEAVAVFYLTVYFVRTKQLKIASVIKLLIFTALWQAFYGIFQSITGIGTNFQNPRGILGYLGIGSKMVKQACGTMGHFNAFGVFILTVFLFVFPLAKDIFKNKIYRRFVMIMLFLAIYFSYSRNCIIGLFCCTLYYLFIMLKNRGVFVGCTTAMFSIIAVLYKFLSGTDYVNTISSRADIRNAVIASIVSSPRNLWFGAGLNSYELSVYAYLPQNNVLWYAHNFYLATAQEIGIIGFLIFFSFLIYVLKITYDAAKFGHGLNKAINMGVTLCVFSIFAIGFFDHAYSSTYAKVLLFTLLGLAYARKANFVSKNN